MSDNNTRPAAGPMYYDDGEFIHACESSIVNGGVRLVWTKCDMDVPDNQGFTVEGAGDLSCRPTWKTEPLTT
jgi:hypothetical protein